MSNLGPSTSQKEVSQRLAALETEGPAQKMGLTILSADVLCVEIHQLLAYIALGNYPRYQQLRNALSAFEEIRFDGIIKGYSPSETFRRFIKEDDPQRIADIDTEPAPETQRSAPS